MVNFAEVAISYVDIIKEISMLNNARKRDNIEIIKRTDIMDSILAKTATSALTSAIAAKTPIVEMLHLRYFSSIACLLPVTIIKHGCKYFLCQKTRIRDRPNLL
jgi:hypothetical protein